MIIGLTGQTGAGKTAAAKVIEGMGAHIIDCDMAARKVTAPGAQVLDTIARTFGESTVKDNVLDRKALGRIVFSDMEKKKQLEDILFPLITAYINENIPKDGITVLDAPTLFEAGLEKMCDVIVAVTADEDIRLQRLCRRDGLSPEDIAKRMASQKSRRFFEENCDYTLDNSADESSFTEAVKALFGRLLTS